MTIRILTGEEAHVATTLTKKVAEKAIVGGAGNALVIRKTQPSRQEERQDITTRDSGPQPSSPLPAPLLFLTALQRTQTQAAASVPLLVLKNGHPSDSRFHPRMTEPNRP